VALAQEDRHLRVAAAVDAPGNPRVGEDAGVIAGVPAIGVPVTAELPLSVRPECVIDFSSPAGTMAILKTCVDRRLPLVVATTGHEPHQKREIESAAHDTAVLYTPNMSLVVNVLFRLTKLAAGARAGQGFGVELSQRHHRFT